MLEEPGDLTPDLDWLLQSGQADEETIVVNLARECYARVYRQAIEKLRYPEAAQRAAREVFLRAAIQAREYAAQGVEAWLDGLTAQIVERERIILDSHAFLNPHLISHDPVARDGIALTPARIEAEIARIKASLRRYEFHRRLRARSLEISLVVGAILAVLFLLVKFTGTTLPQAQAPSSPPATPDQGAFVLAPQTDLEGGGAVIPGLRIERRTLREFYFNPDEWKNGIPPQEPLSLQSTSEDIWRRLLLSRQLWDTLWVDVWLILSGPESYNGPPRAERHQLWIEQSKRALHLSGPASGKPNFVEVIDATSSGPAPAHFLYGVDDYARLGSQYPWFYLSRDTLFNSPYMINLYYMTIGQTFPPKIFQFKTVGEQDWIGRPTVVVEMIGADGDLIARYWLDKHYGIALRAQYFGANSAGVAIFQEDVAQIHFDRTFPDELFRRATLPLGEPRSLLEGDYFVDYTGQTEGNLFPPAIPPVWVLAADNQLSPLPAPPDLDLAHSRLTFQLPDVDSPEYSSGMLKMQVFADRYYLGEIWFADPFNVICDRSPDGNQIAFTQWSGSPDSPPYSYFRFDLRDLNLIEESIPNLHILRLKFAPDNRRLALAGIDARAGYGRLFVVDTLSGERTLLREVDPTWSLDWSPDGRQLAALKWPGARIETGNSLLIRVYDLSAETAYHVQHWAELLGAAMIEVPLEGWTAHFSLPVLGLENCTAPAD